MKRAIIENILLVGLSLGLGSQYGCGEAENVKAADAAVTVAAITAHSAKVPIIREAPGTIEARATAELAAQINGFVRQIHASTGDIVKAGQLLATLDARDQENQRAAAAGALREAEAALAEARQARRAATEAYAAAQADDELAAQTLTRYETMLAGKSVAPQEIDEVRSRRRAAAAGLASRDALIAVADERVRQAESRVEQARVGTARAAVQVGWTQIKSPFAGRIARRLVDDGAAIFSGTPLFTIEAAGAPRARVRVPAGLLSSVATLHAITLHDAQSDLHMIGRVTEIAPSADQVTHSFEFKVELPKSVTLPGGSFVTALIPAGEREALLIPQNALRRTGQLTGVLVAEPWGNAGVARLRLVKTAPYDQDRIEILSGVTDGEQIITNSDLSDGTPVRVVR